MKEKDKGMSGEKKTDEVEVEREVKIVTQDGKEVSIGNYDGPELSHDGKVALLAFQEYLSEKPVQERISQKVRAVNETLNKIGVSPGDFMGMLPSLVVSLTLPMKQDERKAFREALRAIFWSVLATDELLERDEGLLDKLNVKRDPREITKEDIDSGFYVTDPSDTVH